MIRQFLRSYSLSDLPGVDSFRVSIKLEPNGVGSSFLHNHIREGEVLTSARRGVPSPYGLATIRWFCSAPVSVQRRYWRCCTRWRQRHPSGKSGGSMQRVIARITRLWRNRADCCDSSIEDKATFCIAGSNRSGGGWIMMLQDTSALIYWRRGRYLAMATSISAAPLRSYRTCATASRRGVHSDRVHMEIFGALDAVTPGKWRRWLILRTLHRGRRGPGPTVSFARSGLTVAWDPKFGSLELAEACDLSVRWSCRIGVCHTCITGLD